MVKRSSKKQDVPPVEEAPPPAPETSERVIIFVLDESGSMSPVSEKTIAGYNEYLQGLRHEAQSAGLDIRVTLQQFNGNGLKTIYAAAPLATIAPLTNKTYQPASTTPLYDAIGNALRETDAHTRSASTLVVILTDGFENSSSEFSKETIASLIKERESEGWAFVYLGADLSTMNDATAIGVTASSIGVYDQQHPEAAFVMAKAASRSYMRTGRVDFKDTTS